MDNSGSFLIDIFERLLDMKNVLMDFLFEEIPIRGIDFTMWQVLAGGGLIVFLTAAIIKCFL